MADDPMPTLPGPGHSTSERLIYGAAAAAWRMRRRRARPVLLPAAALPSLRRVLPSAPSRPARPAGKGPRSLRATRPRWRPRPPRSRPLRPAPRRRLVPPSQRPVRRAVRALGRLTALVPVIAILASTSLLLAVMPVASLARETVSTYVDVPPLGDDLPDLAVRSVIEAGDGTVMHHLYRDADRKAVEFADIPEQVRRTVLAGEDARFYEHEGVDYRGIARALVANLQSGEIAQGGSTLTQQYVKLLITGNDVTLERKVREAIYAQELERRMTKDEILEGYLNLAYFGEGVYGIATAAEHYFSKTLDELTLTQTAALVATLPAPTSYRPTQEANLQRRNLILDQLESLGWETPEAVAEAKRAPLELKISERPNRFPYFHTYIRSQLLLDPDLDPVLGPAGSEERERRVFEGGLRVRTTLLPQHQRLAQRAVDNQLAGMFEQGFSGALASVDPRDGKVLSMVSGQDFDESKVNLAVLGRGGQGYQPGSAFKMFFLLAALEQGISPRLQLDAPEQITVTRPECPEGWSPGNSDGHASGRIDMYEATAQSVNTYYAQLAAMVGPQAGLEMARRLGITGIPKPGTPEYSNYAVCSLVLGTINVSVLDMAAAYGVLANDGVRCEPYTIWRISDADGKVLYQHEPKCERILSPSVARTAVDMLQGGPRHGTATRASFGRPLGGKTGTAQDYTSAFFAGFTPQVSAAVWVGDPKQPRPMRHQFNGGRVFGGTFPALVFHDYMAAAHEGRPVEHFPPPPAIPSPLSPPANRAGTVSPEQGDDGGDQGGRIQPMGVMPDVTGQPADTAAALLEQLGFQVQQQPAASAADQDGRVIRQSPPPGATLGTTSQATLVVGNSG